MFWKIAPPLCWLCLLAAATSGCATVESEAQRLVGKWVLVDGENLARRVQTDTASDVDDALPPRMELVFRANRTLTTITRINAIDTQKNGTWRFLEARPDGTSIDIQCSLDGQQTLCTVEFLGDDRIKLTPPNMAGVSLKLTFQRESPTVSR